MDSLRGDLNKEEERQYDLYKIRGKDYFICSYDRRSYTDLVDFVMSNRGDLFKYPYLIDPYRGIQYFNIITN